MKTALSLFISLLLVAGSVADVQAAEPTPYAIEPTGNSRVVLKTADAGQWPLDLTFCVLFSEADPSPNLRPAGVGVN